MYVFTVAACSALCYHYSNMIRLTVLRTVIISFMWRICPEGSLYWRSSDSFLIHILDSEDIGLLSHCLELLGQRSYLILGLSLDVKLFIARPMCFRVETSWTAWAKNGPRHILCLYLSNALTESNSFYHAKQPCYRGLRDGNSVRLFVRLSVKRVLCDEMKERTADILAAHERVIIVVFWYQQRLVGDVHFHVKFALKVIHPLWRTPTLTNICL